MKKGKKQHPPTTAMATPKGAKVFKPAASNLSAGMSTKPVTKRQK